jgi:hypothetical protein
MAERKPVSKKLRFEVFKRDSFTCQYCGKSAPDVILHVDHINPVKRGGKNDILNLITSCVDCNLGKGARELSDNSVVTKQQQQLLELGEKNEQLRLMLKWREGMSSIQDAQVQAIVSAFESGLDSSMNSAALLDVKKWLKKYSLEEMLDAVDTSKGQYLDADGDGFTVDSVNKAWEYIPRICSCTRAQKDNPAIKDINYIRAVVRNRCHTFIPYIFSDRIKSAMGLGIKVEELKEIAKACYSWSNWRNTMDDLIDYCSENRPV